jgi:hypothetical protein
MHATFGDLTMSLSRFMTATLLGRIGRSIRRLAARNPQLAPSLYDLLPQADRLPRSLPRTELVPADAIVGTVRHPSNTTAELLPLPHLRGSHWRDDWRRILQAQEALTVLPAVDLVKVDSQYFVVDGHKRAAAARRVGGFLDANVVELHPPIASDHASSRRPSVQRAAGCA